MRPPIATPIRNAIDGRMPTCDGRDEADDRGEQRAGDAGEQRGDGVGDDLDIGGVVAQETHPLFAIAHSHQQLAVSALHELPDHGDDEQQHAGGDEVQHPPVGRVVQGEPEERTKPVESVATTDAGLPDEKDGQCGGQRLGQDREVRALDATFEDAEPQCARRWRSAPG